MVRLQILWILMKTLRHLDTVYTVKGVPAEDLLQTALVAWGIDQ
jgi:hypothetical protein